jgi:predicted nucleotidyltransferase
MSADWVRISKALEEKKRERIEELRLRFCEDALLVVLFGSRARGDATAVSDYDFLVVVEGVRKEFLLEWPAQIFIFGLDIIGDEIRSMNTIVIDALIEGKLICGDVKLFKDLRNLALKEIEGRRLKKTKIGWVRE